MNLDDKNHGLYFYLGHSVFDLDLANPRGGWFHQGIPPGITIYITLKIPTPI